MMDPQEDSLEQIDIEPMPRVIEYKPTYVEFSMERGDTANDLMTTKTPVVAEVEEEVLGVGAVSSTRSYYNKMWKFIVPLTLIAAVSGTIATVSRYEANAKEARSVEQNYPPKPTSDADNLLYVAPETKMSNVLKDGSRTKGSKTSPKKGGAGDFKNEIDGGSLSMSIMMFGINDAGGDRVPSSSFQPQFITTAKAEKASKGSKTILGGNSDSGFETTGSGVERVESLSMSIMMFGIDETRGDELLSLSFQPQFITTAKAEKASKGSKTILGGSSGSETTGSGVERVESMSMITMVEIETHEFNVVNVESTSQQGLLKASKGSKTTKASKETTTTTTSVEPDVESSSSSSSGGSMSMESTERNLEKDYTIFRDSEVEVQNGPVFYRRRYIDYHLL